MRSSCAKSNVASALLLSTGLVLTQAAPARGFEPRDDGKPLVGVYGGTGTRTVVKSIELGVDVLFPAIYWHENPPFLKNIAASAHEHGIEVYPSVAVASDGYEDKHTDFAVAHPEYWEKRRDGRLINSGVQVGLSFGYPEVRKYKVDVLTQMVEQRDVDGVLLDYCRYFGNDAGYADIIVDAFRQRHGKDPHEIPNEDPEWLRFRAGYVTQFVRELHESIDRVNPKAKILACVGPDPDECVARAMQDWAGWLDEGLIDGVVTMIYERDTNNTLKQVMIANETIRGRVTHMPMIAPYGNNLTTPAMLTDGSLKCLTTGTGAVGYYRSDSIFDHELWDTVGEVADWNLDDVQGQPVNYVQNPGFERNFEKWAIGDGRRVEHSNAHARTGEDAARVSLGGSASILQIVDKGFIPDMTSLDVSAWILQPEAPKKGHDTDIIDKAAVAFTVRVHYTDAREESFRIPITVQPGDDWQNVSGRVPIRGSNDLKFVIAGIEASSPLGPYQLDAGSLFVDDMVISLASTGGASGEFKVTALTAPRENKRNENLARGQCVTASSSNGADVEGANVVDGDLSVAKHSSGSAWRSERPATDQWVKVYLPETVLVSRIRLLNNASIYLYRTKEYKVEVSVDDVEYTEVARGTLPNDGDTWTEVSFPPVPARYVRFTGIEGYHVPGMVGLMELEVY